MAVTQLTRRGVIKLAAAAGAVTFLVPRGILAADRQTLDDDEMTLPLVRVNPDNSATIYNPSPDMGQGTSTGLPMMIAEELDLDWSRISVENLPLKRHRTANGRMRFTYAAQGSGGSGSIRRGWQTLPKYGAQGRDMFVRAAAQLWGVAQSRLTTRDSYVSDPASGRKVAYADLIEIVRTLTPRDDVPLKSRREYRLIGKPQKATAANAIVTGQPIFGLDQETDGMLHAVIARCPHFCGRVKSFDAGAARAVPGVRNIIEIEQADKDGPLAWLLVSSIAVLADNLWAAKKARDLLQIEWEAGPFEGLSSADMEAASLQQLDEDTGFDVVHFDARDREEGNYDQAIQQATTHHDAKYVVRRVAHALMEPHSAIADVRSDEVYIHYPCQSPARAQDIANVITGIPHENIHVKIARSGGAFGRRFELDYPAEAIFLSQKLGQPVKVTWTREDELTQCRYRAANNYRMTGGLDDQGRLIALRQRQASDYASLKKSKKVVSEWEYEDLMGWHFEAGIVPNHRMEHRFTASPIPRGAWRAPGSVNSAFAQLSFLDELAHKAGVDPLEFNLNVLGKPRFLPEGMIEDEPDAKGMHTGRMANCLRLAAEKAGWGSPMPSGHGRGIAGYYSHYSFVAHVVEVSVVDGFLTVEKVTSVADCGLVINPLGVKAQIEGAIHDGLSVALEQEITIKNVAVEQSNFDSYQMARIDRAPKVIDIHLVESDKGPTGMGEPAIPPFAPALMNAIFDATGKRVRRLPIADQLTA